MLKVSLEQALKKGHEAFKSGQFQKADLFYTAVLKAQPKHPVANHNMGILAISVGKIKESVPFFRAALEANPSISQFWLSYINALIKLDRKADARYALDQAKSSGAKGDAFVRLEHQLESYVSALPQLHQNPLQDKIDSLKTLFQQGESQKVFQETKELVKKYPNILALWNLMGASASNLGYLNEAIFAFETAISIAPKNAEVYYNLGNIFHEQGQLHEAIELYELAISINPKVPEFHNNKGVAIKDQGKYSEAIDAYNSAILINPNYAEAHNNVGVAQKHQGNLKAAMVAYNTAINIKPNYAEAYNNIGVASFDQGKQREALEAYNKAISIDPSFADAHNNLGVTLQCQGKLAEAVEAYNLALSLNPAYAEALNNLGISYNMLGRQEKAIQAYKKALVLKPNYAEAYNNLGVLYSDQGKLDAAIACYKCALSYKSDYVEAMENSLGLQVQLIGNDVITDWISLEENLSRTVLLKSPKLIIQKAILAFLIADFQLAEKYVERFNRYSLELLPLLSQQDKVFCTSYAIFLEKLLDISIARKLDNGTSIKVFHLGDSHCLSFAHQKIWLENSHHTITSKITFGAKAYHFARDQENKFKAITKVNFDSVPGRSKIFISFGEIDCRPDEGFISAAKKLNQSVEELVESTVSGYLNWFADQNETRRHSLYFFNVPAACYNNGYTREHNLKVAQVIETFNDILLKSSRKHKFKVVDIHCSTLMNNGFSNEKFHIDKIHLGPDIVPEIEKKLKFLS